LTATAALEPSAATTGPRSGVCPDYQDWKRPLSPAIVRHLDRLRAVDRQKHTLVYLPWEYAETGRALSVEYFGDDYPVEVAAVGYKALYDPENLKPRS